MSRAVLRRTRDTASKSDDQRTALAYQLIDTLVDRHDVGRPRSDWATSVTPTVSPSDRCVAGPSSWGSPGPATYRALTISQISSRHVCQPANVPASCTVLTVWTTSSLGRTSRSGRCWTGRWPRSVTPCAIWVCCRSMPFPRPESPQSSRMAWAHTTVPLDRVPHPEVCRSLGSGCQPAVLVHRARLLQAGSHLRGHLLPLCRRPDRWPRLRPDWGHCRPVGVCRPRGPDLTNQILLLSVQFVVSAFHHALEAPSWSATPASSATT